MNLKSKESRFWITTLQDAFGKDISPVGELLNVIIEMICELSKNSNGGSKSGIISKNKIGQGVKGLVRIQKWKSMRKKLNGSIGGLIDWFWNSVLSSVADKISSDACVEIDEKKNDNNDENDRQPRKVIMEMIDFYQKNEFLSCSSEKRETITKHLRDEKEFFLLLLNMINFVCRLNNGKIMDSIFKMVGRVVKDKILLSATVYGINNSLTELIGMVFDYPNQIPGETTDDIQYIGDMILDLDEDGAEKYKFKKDVDCVKVLYHKWYYLKLDREILRLKLIYWHQRSNFVIKEIRYLATPAETEKDKTEKEKTNLDISLLITELRDICSNVCLILPIMAEKYVQLDETNKNKNKNKNGTKLNEKLLYFAEMATSLAVIEKWWKKMDSVLNTGRNMNELKQLTDTGIKQIKWTSVSDTKDFKHQKIFKLITDIKADNEHKTVAKWQKEKNSLIESRKEFVEYLFRFVTTRLEECIALNV